MSRSKQRLLAVAAALAGGVTDVIYLQLITETGTEIETRVAFLASFIGLMTALSLAGAVWSWGGGDRAQLTLLGAATGFLGSGVVGLFSVGATLIVAGVLALIAVGPLRLPLRLAAAPVVGVLALLIAGLALT